MKTTTYLELFFEEKEIKFEAWEIEAHDEIHFIDTDFVIELIKGAPPQEQEQIANQLRKIDFVNGNVNHFLKFLAEAYVKNYYR
jgi:hypothetical protein